MVHLAHSAVIIPFPALPDRTGRLTLRDRADILARQGAAHLRGYGQMLIHTASADAEPGTPDVVMLYPEGERWARWGVARQAAGVLVWRCADGTELGWFSTVAEALDAALGAPDPASRRLRRRNLA